MYPDSFQVQDSIFTNKKNRVTFYGAGIQEGNCQLWPCLNWWLIGKNPGIFNLQHYSNLQIPESLFLFYCIVWSRFDNLDTFIFSFFFLQ
jgi:hypothetical protein